MGAAETGSGKTLAFGLPILSGILKLKEDETTKVSQNNKLNNTKCSVDSDEELEMCDELVALREDADSDVSWSRRSDSINGKEEESDNQEVDSYDGSSSCDEEEKSVSNANQFRPWCNEDFDDENDRNDENESEDICTSDDESIDCHNKEISSEREDLEDDEYGLDENGLGCVRAIDNINFAPKYYPQKPLYALILTPTRELAIQIKNHLVAAAKYTGM